MKFDFNPNDISIGFKLFPKGTYEIEIGEPKTFFREAKEGKEASAGIAVNSKITEGEFKGESYYQSFDLTQSYGEQNAMALLVTSQGFDANDEGVKAFRAKFGSLSFTVDIDQKALGEGWSLMKGQRIFVELDQQPAKDGATNTDGSPKMYQSFPRLIPKKV